MSILHITNENFESEVINSDLPVLIDFWAPWCGPCRMVGPVVEEVAPIVADKIKVAKCDVDEAQQLAVQFGIRSIPTLLIFKKGEVVATNVGSVGKDQLIGFIDENV